MTDLRFPIGRFAPPASISDAQVREWIESIAALPADLRTAFAELTPAERTTPYRTGGWTPHQVVQHLVDSHVNSLVRFKLAMTEDEPTIKPYREDAWVRLADAAPASVDEALEFLTLLHRRWARLLASLSPSDLARAYVHPEEGRRFALREAVGLYAWHGRHHLAHVRSVRGRSPSGFRASL